jgi:hypothetical protein
LTIGPKGAAGSTARSGQRTAPRALRYPRPGHGIRPKLPFFVGNGVYISAIAVDGSDATQGFKRLSDRDFVAVGRLVVLGVAGGYEEVQVSSFPTVVCMRLHDFIPWLADNEHVS